MGLTSYFKYIYTVHSRWSPGQSSTGANVRRTGTDQDRRRPVRQQPLLRRHVPTAQVTPAKVNGKLLR